MGLSLPFGKRHGCPKELPPLGAPSSEAEALDACKEPSFGEEFVISNISPGEQQLSPTSANSKNSGKYDVPPSHELNFVLVKIGPELDQLPISAPALIDSGANCVVVDIAVIKAAAAFKNFNFTPAEKSSKIRFACQDITCKVRGFIVAYLVFRDNHGCSIPLRTKIVVASGLRHFVYIGTPVLNSPHMVGFSQKGLCFDETTPLHDSQITYPTKHHVPVMSPAAAAKYLDCRGTCTTVQEVFLEPHTFKKVVCNLQFPRDRPLSSPFIAVFDQHSRPSELLYINVVPMVTPHENLVCSVYLHNNNVEPVVVGQGSIIADFESFSEITYAPKQFSATCEFNDLCQIELSAFSFHDQMFECQNILHDPSTAHETSDYHCTNIHQIPLQDLVNDIEQRRSISLDKTNKILSPSEIANLLDLSHLSPAQQSLVRRLVAHYRDVFAASTSELSATNVVELDVALTTANLDSYATKYRQIPLADQKEVTQILDQLAQAKIITRAYGPILLISNLLTRRKKNNSLRILLDNRVPNAVSRKFQDTGSAPLLSQIADMNKAALVSTSDMASSFFQVSVTEKLRSLLCFRSPDRSIWQFNRAAQGYINSAAALNLAVSRAKSLPILDKELCSFLPHHTLPGSKPTEDEIRLLQTKIPKQTIGNFEQSFHNHSTVNRKDQPNYTHLSLRDIRSSRLVSLPNHCTIGNYVDDMILTSPPVTEPKHSAVHPHDGPERYFSLRSGRKIFTSPCSFCSSRDNNIPQWDDFILHLQTFELLLAKFRKANIKLSPAKTHVATSSVSLLGAVWQPGRLSLSRLRLNAFRNININSCKSLHSALCTISYHRTQIPRFSSLAQPLLQVIKSKKFVWGADQKHAWETLLSTLEENSVVHIFDKDKEIVISSDASSHACAGTLTQACHSKQRLIAAVSRSFTTSELSQSILRKEIIGVIYCLTSFDPLIRHCPHITLEIDSDALRFIKFAKDSNPFLTRLSLMLSEYNITKIIHVPSAVHDISDSLSRLTKENRKFYDLLSEYKPMSEAEAIILVRKIATEKGTIFTNDSNTHNLNSLLQGPSLPSCIPAKTKNKPNKAAAMNISFKPKFQRERTIRQPYGLNRRILPFDNKFRKPKYIKKQISDQRRLRAWQKQQRQRHDKETFTLKNNNLELHAITRSMTKSNESNHVKNPPIDGQPEHENVRTQPEHAPATDQNITDDVSYDHVVLHGRIVQDGQLSVRTLRKLQREDEFLSQIIQNISMEKYARDFTIKDDVLFHTRSNMIPRLCLPTILLEPILKQYHFSVFNTHSPFNAFYTLVKTKFYHPALEKIARRICDECTLCKTTLIHNYRESSLGTLPVAEKRQFFYCDLALYRNNPARHVFLAVDSLTLFTLALPLLDKSENSIYKAILILASVFTPRTLKFDNESGAVGLVSRLKELDIEVHFSAPGSSFSNGVVEKRIGLAKEILRTLKQVDAQLSDEELCSLISINLNRKIVLGKKFCSELLMFNNSVPLENSLIKVSENCTNEEGITETFNKAFEQYMSERKNRNDKQREAANLTRRKSKYQVGDIVYCTNRNIIKGQKSLQISRTGPYTIEAIEAGGFTAVLKHVSTNAYIKRRLSYLTPATNNFADVLVNKAFLNQTLEPQNEKLPNE